MNYIQTEIDGVWLIEPKVFSDERGYFMEAFKKEEFEANIGPVDFVQDNESKSSFGVLRGLHYQKGEHSQAKLVRVIKGEVLDVAVDLRKSSPTFGKHVCVLLSEENKRQFFIPADVKKRLKDGNRQLYDNQYLRYRAMLVSDERLRPLVAMIHKYGKAYEQEGYIKY